MIVAGLTYQPPAPSVPCSWGVITGGPAIAAGTATRSSSRTAAAAVPAGPHGYSCPAGRRIRASWPSSAAPAAANASTARPPGPGGPVRGSRTRERARAVGRAARRSSGATPASGLRDGDRGMPVCGRRPGGRAPLLGGPRGAVPRACGGGARVVVVAASTAPSPWAWWSRPAPLCRGLLSVGVVRGRIAVAVVVVPGAGSGAGEPVDRGDGSGRGGSWARAAGTGNTSAATLIRRGAHVAMTAVPPPPRADRTTGW